jgi:hypothetical protein
MSIKYKPDYARIKREAAERKAKQATFELQEEKKYVRKLRSVLRSLRHEDSKLRERREEIAEAIIAADDEILSLATTKLTTRERERRKKLQAIPSDRKCPKCEQPKYTTWQWIVEDGVAICRKCWQASDNGG